MGEDRESLLYKQMFHRRTREFRNGPKLIHARPVAQARTRGFLPASNNQPFGQRVTHVLHFLFGMESSQRLPRKAVVWRSTVAILSVRNFVSRADANFTNSHPCRSHGWALCILIANAMSFAVRGSCEQVHYDAVSRSAIARFWRVWKLSFSFEIRCL